MESRIKPVIIQPGTLLQNRYRVAEQVGQGGMGEVYVATDERFQSTVAVKRTFYDDAEMSRAFEREARLLNRLRHAALPKVSDHFSEGGSQFLVMEFIEGSDLSELLRRRKVPFPLADVLRWADELLDALDYLHTQELPVVHRDIKPPNIKLTPRGKVVLLDFGLAKGMPAQNASGAASSVFGYSVNFAPLEQMQGCGTDPRSDLYSLAATLYFLLTGVRSPDALTRAAATIKQQPDPLRPAHLVQAQVTAEVGRILHRAMSQNAALRHASAAELRAALRQAANKAAPREARPQASAADALTQSLPSPQAAAAVETPIQLQGPYEPAAPAHTHLTGAAINLHPSPPSTSEVVAPVDSRREPHLSDSYTVSARVASARSASVVSTRAGAASNRSFGIIACLLVVCVAAGAYLLARASGSGVPAAGADAATQNSAPASQQNAPAEAKAPAANAVASDSSHAAPGSDAPAQSVQARPAGETTASGSHAAAETTGTPDPAGTNAKGSGATPDGASDVAGASTVGRPALVIQNPASATNPTDQSRRTEEPRREPPAYRQEYADRPPPPPGTAYPPPPDGRRPPPPHLRRPPRP
jgi:serine/threonine protein kinase